jgi:hypothetical protein
MHAKKGERAMLSVAYNCLRELYMATKKKAGKKNAVAQAMVAMRNKKLTPERRSEIAKAAAAARWEKREEN